MMDRVTLLCGKNLKCINKNCNESTSRMVVNESDERIVAVVDEKENMLRGDKTIPSVFIMRKMLISFSIGLCRLRNYYFYILIVIC